MAAFSSYQLQHFPFHLLDSVFLQMPRFSEEPNNNTTTSPTHHCFSQFPHHRSVGGSTTYLEQSNTKISLNNQQSINTNNNKQSTDSSSMVVDSGELVTHKLVSMDNKRKFNEPSSFNNSAHESKDTRDDDDDEELGRMKKQKKISNGGMKKNEEDQKKKKKKMEGEVEEEKGYIHVRARRGQATDSHSLAERLRREKISEKMKLLQALVPGCDKVTGKALMLDEIINYVQSLQYQVEFLSMKLACLNPMLYDFGIGMLMDDFIVKHEQGSPNQQSTGTIMNTFTTPNNYHPAVLDTSTNSLVFQQPLFPNILPQSTNGEMLWDEDVEKQLTFFSLIPPT